MNIEFSEFSGRAVLFMLTAGVYVSLLAARSAASRIFVAARFLVLMLLVFIYLGPQIAVMDPLQRKSVVAVMLDVSKSMLIKDGEKRMEKARSFIVEQLPHLNKKYAVKFYPFSGSSAPADIENFDFADITGSSTDISAVLGEVGRELRGVVSAGVLITDGVQNVPGDAALEAKLFGAPIYCVGVGSESGMPDAAAGDVKASDFAFKNTPVEIESVAAFNQMKGRKIAVTLKEGNETVGVKQIEVTSDYQEETVKFKYTPKKVGRFDYRIFLPPIEGEASENNNSKSFSIDILREKLRVLFICGQPGTEYSLLRRVLKSDPSVELVSFVILRNPANTTFVAEGELSLIPFPANEIFIDKLFNFDLLIFENFTYTQFGFSRIYLENIRSYVAEKGGSFLMIGGRNSFGSGGYANTPIADILPVAISQNEVFSVDEAGLNVIQPGHTIMRLASGDEENIRAWSKLPKLESYNLLGPAKSGAQVLASEAKTGSPLIACWEAGKGRSMVVASNTSWHWALKSAGQGSLAAHYNRFWMRAVRWLTRADNMKLVLISADKKKYELDDKMIVKILVSDKSYQPLSGAEIEFEIVKPDKTRSNVGVYESGPGEYFTTLKLENFGVYKLTARAYDGREKPDSRFLGEDVRLIEVSSISREDDSLRMNKQLLENISKASGGYFAGIDSFSFDQMNESLKKKSSKFVRKKIQFWNSPYFFAAILILLGLEWYFRRKKGLL